MNEKKKLLLVDDDPLIIRMYEKKLTHDGYDVETARNGEEAITSLHRGIPDLILLDVMMPKMNGVETLHIIKEDEKTKNIPIIMLSNLGDSPEDMEKAKELGVREYLVKANTDLKTLSQHITQAIESKTPVAKKK